MTDLCIPSPEARGEPWHWARHKSGHTVPAHWHDVYGDATGLCWVLWDQKPMSCERATQVGFRWIGIAKPPEET